LTEVTALNGANLLKSVLTHPFLGRYFRNVSEFGAEHGLEFDAV
jgi:hypothetical protein